ncbi:hypothetical protein Tco_0392618 [Tanacetum coccineum]
MKRKAIVIENSLDAEIRIISLVSIQNLHETKTKRCLSGVLGVIAKMKMRKRLMKKLVSWLNRQMRSLENEILELEEKIKRLERNKNIDIGCESCQELHLENDKLKEFQAKFIKFDQSANSLKEMLNAQRSPCSKGGLGFNKDEASTCGTKQVKFVKSANTLAGDESFIKEDGSFIKGSVDPPTSQKGREHVFKPATSSRSDFLLLE